MTYTNKEYLEMAAKANIENKILRVINGNLILEDKPTLSLEELKSIKYKEINEARENARTVEGAEFDNDIFDIDSQSQINISGMVTLAMVASQSGQEMNFTYRSKTNQNHELTPAQLMALGVAISMKIDAIYKKSWELKALVDSAASVEDMEKITWQD